MRLHYPIGHEGYDNYLFKASIDFKYNPFLYVDEVRMVTTKNDERGLAREREEWHGKLAGQWIKRPHPVEEDIRQAFDRWINNLGPLPLFMPSVRRPAKLHFLLFSHHNPNPFHRKPKRIFHFSAKKYS